MSRANARQWIALAQEQTNVRVVFFFEVAYLSRDAPYFKYSSSDCFGFGFLSRFYSTLAWSLSVSPLSSQSLYSILPLSSRITSSEHFSTSTAHNTTYARCCPIRRSRSRQFTARVKRASTVCSSRRRRTRVCGVRWALIAQWAYTILAGTGPGRARPLPELSRAHNLSLLTARELLVCDLSARAAAAVLLANARSGQ